MKKWKDKVIDTRRCNDKGYVHSFEVVSYPNARTVGENVYKECSHCGELVYVGPALRNNVTTPKSEGK